MQNYVALIAKLGGPTKVARALTKLPSAPAKTLSPEAVIMWRKRGRVAGQWQVSLLELARKIEAA